jgi:aspartyl/asparaginyl-tRNA synthetase
LRSHTWNIRAFTADHFADAPTIASILCKASEEQKALHPKAISVVGHVRTIRNQKRWSFVELGDGSTTSTLQALLKPEQAKG